MYYVLGPWSINDHYAFQTSTRTKAKDSRILILLLVLDLKEQEIDEY